MGEAKKKLSRLENLKISVKYCIYCGDDSDEYNIDHMPPRIMFEFKNRPRGLEFLSCKECNKNSSLSEQVASLMARVHFNATQDKSGTEVKKLFRAIGENIPDLLFELNPSVRQKRKARKLANYQEDYSAVLNATGPLLNKHMKIFGAKLLLALHFEATRMIVPKDARICVLWYSNEAAIDGSLPSEAIALCGDPKTLTQGRFSVENQFLYGSSKAADSMTTMHFATFRNSFAILGLVDCTPSRQIDIPSENLFFSGFLKNLI